MSDVIVVGAGMIGAAAVRQLAAAGADVVAIGPGEPTNWQTHSGVYASHYDQGRITRRVDPDPVWALLGARSLDAYRNIEADSGICFHHHVGCLRITAEPGSADDSLARARQNGLQCGAKLVDVSTAELAQTLPFLYLPESATGLFETGGAGYINPRELIQAQFALSRTERVRTTAIDLTRRHGLWQVTCDDGKVYAAPKVLVTTGAFTNGLLPDPLDLRPRAATTLLVALSTAEAQRLRQMPAIIYRLPENPLVFSIYALPPIRYPDGNLHLKMGFTFHQPRLFTTQDSLRQWYKGPGESEHREAMIDILSTLVPNLQVEGVHTRPCAVTYTAHGYPYIAAVADELYVAVGGCGAAAKSSPEIGRVAAMLVEKERWRYDVPAETFKAVSRPKSLTLATHQ